MIYSIKLDMKSIDSPMAIFLIQKNTPMKKVFLQSYFVAPPHVGIIKIENTIARLKSKLSNLPIYITIITIILEYLYVVSLSIPFYDTFNKHSIE